MKHYTRNIMIILLSSAVLITVFFIHQYLTDTEQLVFSMTEGVNFIYEGEYITRGNQKIIRMNAPPHKLVVEREFQHEGEKRWLLSFRIGEMKLHSFILTISEEGLYFLTGDTRTLAIPAELKKGKKWRFNFGSQEVTGTAGSRKLIRTSAGSFPAREISFQTNTRSRIKIWLNDNTGIVALNYSHIYDNLTRNEAELVLAGIDNEK
jgi:hypothetical protein